MDRQLQNAAVHHTQTQHHNSTSHSDDLQWMAVSLNMQMSRFEKIRNF
jgi:hypothetical protein